MSKMIRVADGRFMLVTLDRGSTMGVVTYEHKKPILGWSAAGGTIMSQEQGEAMDMAADRAAAMEEELLRRIRLILVAVGEPGVCKGCSVPIYWLKHANGKRAPYTPEGQSHFADCPEAARFRKKATCEDSGK